jgi:hypothetical protein
MALHGSLHPTLLRSFFDIRAAKTWDGKLPLPRNEVSEAPPLGFFRASRLRQNESTKLRFLQRQLFVICKFARRRLVSKKEYSRHEIEVSKPHDCGARRKTCIKVGGMGGFHAGTSTV